MVRTHPKLETPFSWAHGLNPTLAGHSRFARVLLITRLPHGYTSSTGGKACWAYPHASDVPLCCHVHGCGTRLLTGFPICPTRLRLDLGPADPRPTNVDEEPLPFRRPGFTPGIVATSTRIFVTMRSTRSHERASCHTVRPPTPSPVLPVGCNIGDMLSPESLRRQNP